MRLDDKPRVAAWLRAAGVLLVLAAATLAVNAVFWLAATVSDTPSLYDANPLVRPLVMAWCLLLTLGAGVAVVLSVVVAARFRNLRVVAAEPRVDAV